MAAVASIAAGWGGDGGDGGDGGHGAGLFNYSYSIATVISCTFVENVNGNGGDRGGRGFGTLGYGSYGEWGSPGVGNIYNFAFSSLSVTNCILWDSTFTEIYQYPIVTDIFVAYSNIRGGYEGVGNIDADPCFVDILNSDQNVWNVRLKADSPCIDTGDNNNPNLPLTDFDGRPRIIDGDCNGVATVDMGAYEFNYAYMGDLDCNCKVDFGDFSVLGPAWMAHEGDPDWDWVCDISDPPDNVIDMCDVVVLVNNWLATP